MGLIQWLKRLFSVRIEIDEEEQLDEVLFVLDEEDLVEL